MSAEPNLAELLTPRPPGPKHQFTARVAELRAKESRARTSKARQLAMTALGRLHPDDFDALYRQAAAKVNLEAGPLPGDEA